MWYDAGIPLGGQRLTRLMRSGKLARRASCLGAIEFESSIMKRMSILSRWTIEMVSSCT